MSSKLGAGAIIAAIMSLGACSPKPAADLGSACPPTQLAVPSDSIGHSDEEGNIRYVATLEKLVSGCSVNADHVAVDLAFDVKAERGPAFQEEPINLTYYIATVDPKREIVDKKLLDVALELQPEQAAYSVREELTLHLPISSDASGANYSLYLGFQPDR